uniref:CD3 gamma/delta subunit Ig-like domain-containing protein n=1 Tax=Chelydra serpentina TaxID=8475 RepID=A0A8C3RX61_CHESE
LTWIFSQLEYLYSGGVLGNPPDVTWERDGITMSKRNREFNLGAEANDPRGVFKCNDSDPVQLHFRMCQNCIELDAATISGIVVADVIATVFLAVAVYCIAGQDSGRLLRASDRQNLIANEQLYQVSDEWSLGQPFTSLSARPSGLLPGGIAPGLASGLDLDRVGV